MNSIVRITVVVSALLFSTSLFAQQVTFDDLIKMNSDKASDAHSHLPEKKKWTKDTGVESVSDSAVLVYKMEFTGQDKARHWVSVYSENDKPKSVAYQTITKEYIDQIILEMEKSGFQLVNTKVTDNTKVLYYSKDLLKVEISTISAETNLGPVYVVTLNS